MQPDLMNDLSTLRAQKPVILNLTNFVTMEFMANGLLSLGAAPIMSCAQEETEELLRIASALNINIGTLTPEFIDHAMQAAEIAKRLEKPVILDPVGAGASAIRTDAARKLAPLSDVVKGNASEIIALAGGVQKTKGVESDHSTDQAEDSANILATEIQGVVLVSGEIDYVTDGSRNQEISGGDAMMGLVTGMGCTFGAVTAAFCAIQPDYVFAAAHAAQYFAQCGSHAAALSDHPGQFRTAFIDALHQPQVTEKRLAS